MGKPIKTKFIPTNPQKYIANNVNEIVSRSSWETHLMYVLDRHESIKGWASEAIRIPYRNPLTNKMTIYIPDFFVIYDDKNGVEHRELIEVKPQQEVPGYRGKVSKITEARQIVNMAKWQAAIAFCQSRNWTFRVATEADMFGYTRKIK